VASLKSRIGLTSCPAAYLVVIVGGAPVPLSGAKGGVPNLKPMPIVLLAVGADRNASATE
jgi:hypothetical protein